MQRCELEVGGISPKAINLQPTQSDLTHINVCILSTAGSCPEYSHMHSTGPEEIDRVIVTPRCVLILLCSLRVGWCAASGSDVMMALWWLYFC